jgi:Subtilase family
MPVKVLDSAGNGTYASISAGIIWATDHGARLINLSLGSTAYSQTVCDAVTYAANAGAVVVAAAGNNGTSTAFYPAACPGAIGVAATDSTDTRASFSKTSYPNVFVSAPGVSILSDFPGGGFKTDSGTSMATPLVSGIADLLLAQNPGRSVRDVRMMLAGTADKIGTTTYGGDPYATCVCSWNSQYGYGRINAYRALTEAPPGGRAGLHARLVGDHADGPARQERDGHGVVGEHDRVRLRGRSQRHRAAERRDRELQPDLDRRRRQLDADGRRLDLDPVRELHADDQGDERQPRAHDPDDALRPSPGLHPQVLDRRGDRRPGRQADDGDLADQHQRLRGHRLALGRRRARRHDDGALVLLDQRHEDLDADDDHDRHDRPRHLPDHGHGHERLARSHRGLHADRCAGGRRLHPRVGHDLDERALQPRDHRLLQADGDPEVRVQGRGRDVGDRYPVDRDRQLEPAVGERHLDERGLLDLHPRRPGQLAGRRLHRDVRRTAANGATRTATAKITIS